MDPTGSGERGRVAGWVLASLSVCAGLACCAQALRYDTALNFAAVGVTTGTGCCLLSAFILDHRPADRAAWALMGTGLISLLSAAVSVWAGIQIATGQLVNWSAAAIGLTAAQYWFLLVFLALFPDGRRPDPPWPAVLAAYTVMTVLLAGLSVGLGLVDPTVTIRHLSDLDAPPGALAPVEQLGGIYLGLTVLLGLGSLLHRLSRADSGTRRSLRLALAGIALSGVVLSVALSIPGGALVLDLLVVCAPLPFLIAVTMAMRGIYHVDHVVRPVVTYTVITVLLAGIYAGVTITVGTLASQVRYGSALAASAATLAAAAAARPLLLKVRLLVDRRFDRRAWQAVRVVDGLTRDLADGSASPADVLPVLRRALDDASATVAYRVGERTVDLAGTTVHLPVDERPGGRLRREVSSGSGPVAVVDLDPRLAGEPRLVDAVLAAAVLPLQNAGLHARAAVHVAQVEASRERIVQAGDVERRRIERDLHDGAQQGLMALALRLRMVQRSQPAGSPVAEELSGAVGDVLGAVEQLRELTRGILPSVLTDEGLAVALRAVAGRLPVPVQLDVATTRFPPTAEVTAWFFACEGITNAVKHAAAQKVRVQIAASAGGLMVRVDDDGDGAASIRSGGGLQGLADRVSAIGGRFDLQSEPGSGTRLEAWLPCA